MAQYNWITIKEAPDWLVDYDAAKKRYRISYFENGHFLDEIIFRESAEQYGEWIEAYETFIDDGGQESFPIQTGYVCSECDKDGDITWSFCPHCGIRMRNACGG